MSLGVEGVIERIRPEEQLVVLLLQTASSQQVFTIESKAAAQCLTHVCMSTAMG